MIGSPPPLRSQRYQRGLDGLIAGDTAISDLDGERGRLSYRGYPVAELAAVASFEEVSHLVLFGELPDHAPAPRLERRAGALAAAAAGRLRRPPHGAAPRPPPRPVQDDADGGGLPHPGGGELGAGRRSGGGRRES